MATHGYEAASSSSSSCFLCSSAYSPFVPNQLVVRAALDDAALVEDEDLVGVADGRDAVRHDDRRPLPHDAAQPRQNFLLGVGVDRRQRSRRGSGCADRSTIARAIAVRCFWPPDSVMPRSPTIVS